MLMLSKKKETEAAVVSEGGNSNSAPVLTELNICNTNFDRTVCILYFCMYLKCIYLTSQLS